MSQVRAVARLLLLLGFVGSFPGPACPEVREVTLLFTNDFESAFEIDPPTRGRYEVQSGPGGGRP